MEDLEIFQNNFYIQRLIFCLLQIISPTLPCNIFMSIPYVHSIHISHAFQYIGIGTYFLPVQFQNIFFQWHPISAIFGIGSCHICHCMLSSWPVNIVRKMANSICNIRVIRCYQILIIYDNYNQNMECFSLSLNSAYQSSKSDFMGI